MVTSTHPRIGKFDALHSLPSSDGPPLSLLNTSRVCCHIPFDSRVAVRFATKESMADAIPL